MYYHNVPGKGVRNGCNIWLLQLLRALTLYQSLHVNFFMYNRHYSATNTGASFRGRVGGLWTPKDL